MKSEICIPCRVGQHSQCLVNFFSGEDNVDCNCVTCEQEKRPEPKRGVPPTKDLQTDTLTEIEMLAEQ